MSFLDLLSQNTAEVVLTEPISLRGLSGLSITRPIKLIFKLPTPYNGPLVDATDCRHGTLSMLNIENAGAVAGCGLLLARSSPTMSCDYLNLDAIHISGPYKVSALLLVGAEMINVRNGCFRSNHPGSSGVRVVATLRNPVAPAEPLVLSKFGPIGMDGTNMASVSQSVVKFDSCGIAVDAGGNSDAVRIGQGTSSITWYGGAISMNVAGARSAFKIGEIGGTKCQFISILGRPQIESPLVDGKRNLEHCVYVDNAVEHLSLELGIRSSNNLITERAPGLIIS